MSCQRVLARVSTQVYILCFDVMPAMVVLAGMTYV